MIDGKPLSDTQCGTHALEEKDILEVVKRIEVGNPLSDALEECNTRNEVKNPFGKKRKIEERNFEKNRRERVCKYIGETHRSAYEHGKEHVRGFMDLDEKRHLLKHYLKTHTDLQMKEMKIGMRVRVQFRSALDRQDGEAN